MSRRILLGVDIGSSSAKGVALDADTAQVVASASAPTGMSNPQPGWFEQDAQTMWWGTFVRLIADLLGATAVRSGQVLAVAVSAIGPCLLPVDAASRPLRSGIMYGIDSRASAEVAELTDLAAERGVTVALSSQSVLPKLMWLRRHQPLLTERTAAVVGADGYINLRLTGRSTLDRYDAGAYGPVFDPETQGWRAGFEDVVDPALLPELGWTTQVGGTVTAQAAGETGLAEGTPVMIGTADAAAEAIGAGATAPGDLMVMLGTTGYFIVQTPRRVRDTALWPSPGFAPGTHVLAGGMNTVGALTVWLRDLLGLSPDGGFRDLVALAGSSPAGARGLLALPYLAGERTPIDDPRAAGVLAGLRLDHTRADIARAGFEAIACGVADNVATMVAEGHAVSRVVAVGGGAANEVLLQAIADACGVQVHVPGAPAGAAFGDALRAGVGAGVFGSLAEAAAAVPAGTVVTPDAAHTALYRERLALYRDLYRATAGVVHALGADRDR